MSPQNQSEATEAAAANRIKAYKYIGKFPSVCKIHRSVHSGPTELHTSSIKIFSGYRCNACGFRSRCNWNRYLLDVCPPTILYAGISYLTFVSNLNMFLEPPSKNYLGCAPSFAISVKRVRLSPVRACFGNDMTLWPRSLVIGKIVENAIQQAKAQGITESVIFYKIVSEGIFTDQIALQRMLSVRKNSGNRKERQPKKVITSTLDLGYSYYSSLWQTNG